MRTAVRIPCALPRRPPWRAVALGVLLTAAGAVPAAAAGLDDFVGKPVVDVELVSDGIALHDEAILELVETRVGEPLSMRQVRESVTHLFSLGRFENVAVDGRVGADGVVLRYSLAPLQIIERIEIDGRAGVSAAAVRRAVTDAHGPVFRPDQAPAVADTLRRFYRERGFLSAAVDTRVERRGAQPALRVEVRPGSRVRIDRFTVRGVSATMYPLILDRLGLERGMPYDGRDIDRRLRDYEAELRRRRYYEIDLRHEIEVMDGGGLVHLILDVRHGPQITVELAGDEVVDADLDVLVPIEREGSVDEDLLEDADRRISGLLQDRGYRDAVVTHAREAAGEGLSLVFTVEQGRPYRIERIAFAGNAAVPELELLPLVAVEPDSPLVMRDLDVSADLVAEHYRRLGYATVRVEPLVVELPAAGDAPDAIVRVVCTIDIVEGPRATVQSIVVEGSRFRSGVELVATMESEVGGAYFARQVAADRDRIHALYLDAGYDRAVVTVEPRFDDSLTAVDLAYRIVEGPQTLVEHILIAGNETISPASIRREITLEEGEPLGLSAVAETRRRLNALGLFRRIDIREFSHGRRDRRDVVVVVEEAAATRLAYGGGFEVSQRLRRVTDAGRGVSQAVEQLEFAPRGFVQIGRRNLWGKNRSIDLFTRVSVRRQNDPVLLAPAEANAGFGFNEYRVLGTYTEPRAFGSDLDLFVTGFVEEAIRPGFDLFSRGFNAETRGQVTPWVSTSVGYSWGKNDTSNVQLNPEDVPLVDRLFEKVRLSSFSGSLLRDTRDDVVDPTAGEVLSIDARVAARAIGSEVGFAKAFTQAFIYRRMPGVRRIVLAAGVRLGIAVGFPQGGVGSNPLLPISERFFAGGDTTVRGYAFDRLGIPAGQAGATIDADGFPQGGNAVVILNSEVRVPVTRDLGVVGFLDGGNVYDHVSNISLGRIRGGIGFGVRYRSPVGPIRVDLGFKLDRQELGSGPNRERERLTALHISIGQAF
ncbi:MAG: BamA/TamA family outer membrane protein [Acidobacteria bacterium]|nr:BamA/TamA family outer membrane protein [Acidobacteriota bacterium]